MSRFPTPCTMLLVLPLLLSSCTRDTPEPAASEPRAERDEGLVEVKGSAPGPTGGFGSIVVLEPAAGVEIPPPSEAAMMDQAGSAFHPKILLVRLGQPVAFRNSEDVLHNVHVVDAETRKTIFNVGTPVVGSYRHVFESEGAYDVSCEIHPSMAAFVFVTASPYAAVADGEGRFEISRVPRGRYRATVWNLDPTRRTEREVEILPGTELDLTKRP
jgi:plastocyanin